MRKRAAIFALLVAIILLAVPARRHWSAARVLQRFAAASESGAVATRNPDVEEVDQVLAGSTRARFYLPRGAPDAPGLVISHGVHRLGIDEPRLVRFARSLAASGVVVLTPELRELADYRLDPRSIEAIGLSAAALRARTSHPVGVMGMSFAGGLSLLAAVDPRYRSDIGLVVAIGAHDDAARVCRFFATNQIERADGGVESLPAHDYGAVVFIYSHAQHFFSDEDLPRAREVLRLWLAEKRDEARAQEAELGPSSRDLIDRVFEHRLEELRPQILHEVESDRVGLESVSPHQRLTSLGVPVFLLHGSGDTVIPPSETGWLARDVPKDQLRDVLVSPSIVHIELTGKPTWHDQWSLVHFLADVLGELHEIGSAIPAAAPVAPPVAPPPTVPTDSPAFHATVSDVEGDIRDQMHWSWHRGCPVDTEHLRVVTGDHFDFAGTIEKGTIIVHEDVAEAVRAVLEKLFLARYPIAKMVPIDAFQGDDDRSTAANNSSGFNCREIAGKPGVWSQHAYGRAIDLNPVQNPYVRDGVVSPVEGQRFADRSLRDPGVIHEGDAVVRAFDEAGWHWGGRWKQELDYQHFSPANR
jgi:acetyl esterase/lipase